MAQAMTNTVYHDHWALMAAIMRYRRGQRTLDEIYAAVCTAPTDLRIELRTQAKRFVPIYDAWRADPEASDNELFERAKSVSQGFKLAIDCVTVDRWACNLREFDALRGDKLHGLTGTVRSQRVYQLLLPAPKYLLNVLHIEYTLGFNEQYRNPMFRTKRNDVQRAGFIHGEAITTEKMELVEVPTYGKEPVTDERAMFPLTHILRMEEALHENDATRIEEEMRRQVNNITWLTTYDANEVARHYVVYGGVHNTLLLDTLTFAQNYPTVSETISIDVDKLPL